jgi:hypothetical protein
MGFNIGGGIGKEPRASYTHSVVIQSVGRGRKCSVKRPGLEAQLLCTTNVEPLIVNHFGKTPFL